MPRLASPHYNPSPRFTTFHNIELTYNHFFYIKQSMLYQGRQLLMFLEEITGHLVLPRSLEKKSSQCYYRARIVTSDYVELLKATRRPSFNKEAAN